ncbi:S-adenosyl-L-methionine-dependent methyltransferase [Zychaea mexicana]|uniref:S-adenosyl-L-methionine-dependent methyltransferase n=1 Tax=Zychaea mexicana TaxID=64656 RepID=UPI0022FDC6D7|nr:S-adenosyl-L-methionine-dependent methyltransferase [Zychaea mexicana]KAI9499321.1 S-adenosyl-L-methionine-dependent methyltransferase [Zychaea mexicana]
MAVKAVPFHSKEYWESRFDKENHYEWLSSWQTLQSHIEPYLEPGEPILHLGCGNSTMAFDMADRGYPHIVNVDYAQNVVQNMRSMTDTSRYPHVTWHTADCLRPIAKQLQLDSTAASREEYSVVIDKSLVDAIACGDTDDLVNQQILAQNIMSVTRPHGIWISLSFSGEREHVAQQGKWTWRREHAVPIKADQSHDKPGAPQIYYWLYIMRKTETS